MKKDKLQTFDSLMANPNRWKAYNLRNSGFFKGQKPRSPAAKDWGGALPDWCTHQLRDGLSFGFRDVDQRQNLEDSNPTKKATVIALKFSTKRMSWLLW